MIDIDIVIAYVAEAIEIQNSTSHKRLERRRYTEKAATPNTHERNLQALKADPP